MATNRNHSDDPGGEIPQLVAPFPAPPKDIITILGVQGLSHNDYSLCEIKIGLRIIKHAQKVITDYSIRYQYTADSFYLTPEQRIAGHTDVTMRLSDFNFPTRNNRCLGGIMMRMSDKGIDIPRKVGDLTIYVHFDHLFTCERFFQQHGRWMVTLRFDTPLLRHFYSFDKGATRIDLNVIDQCRSASSAKLYIMKNCWAMKGYTRIKPENLMGIMHGSKTYYKTWSQMERKSLQFAFADLKRLYDHGIVDQYLTYKPFFRDDENADRQHHHQPEHITIFIHNRGDGADGDDGGEISDELRGERSKLKLKLIYQYDVAEKVATQLSQRLTLGLIGELADWFQHKDYYLLQCDQARKHMNRGGYIAKGLRGFLDDHHV